MRTKIQTPLKPVLLIAAVMCCLLFSCNKKTEDKNSLDNIEFQCGKWYLKCYYDNGWSNTGVECDSLQMLSTKEAYIYNNGQKTKIVAQELRPLYFKCR